MLENCKISGSNTKARLYLASDANSLWKESSLTLSDEQVRSEIQLNRTSVLETGLACSSSAPMLLTLRACASQALGRNGLF